MKLIDLLVQELPKRGGWPKQAEKCWQSSIDGEITMKSNCGSPINHGLGFKKLDMCTERMVTREQYEAALAASQKPVWNGEGLPPVGCECEIDVVDCGWTLVTVKYLGNSYIVVDTTEGYECSFKLSNCKFRSIRTEAERKRDAAVEAICLAGGGSVDDFLGKDDGQGDVYGAAWFNVYDAIAAGKVPGVTLL
jgi:hypothetical protein